MFLFSTALRNSVILLALVILAASGTVCEAASLLQEGNPNEYLNESIEYWGLLAGEVDETTEFVEIAQIIEAARFIQDDSLDQYERELCEQIIMRVLPFREPAFERDLTANAISEMDTFDSYFVKLRILQGLARYCQDYDRLESLNMQLQDCIELPRREWISALRKRGNGFHKKGIAIHTISLARKITYAVYGKRFVYSEAKIDERIFYFKYRRSRNDKTPFVWIWMDMFCELPDYTFDRLWTEVPVRARTWDDYWYYATGIGEYSDPSDYVEEYDFIGFRIIPYPNEITIYISHPRPELDSTEPIKTAYESMLDRLDYLYVYTIK